MTKKTVLITGSTDGIGLATARKLVSLGHQVLIHGRNNKKVEAVVRSLASEFGESNVESYVADLSVIQEVDLLAKSVIAKHPRLDVLINNAGVFVVPNPITADGLDIRFVVNTISPYLLTKLLLPILDNECRVINLSSAAQSSVDLDALAGSHRLSDSEAYAQSKLAITMWSRHLAEALKTKGPAIIAVNPGSFLGSKMVKEAYGRDGKDIGIGADILTRAAIDEEFSTASGQYFDNDTGSFAPAHPDVLVPEATTQVVNLIDALLAKAQKV